MEWSAREARIHRAHSASRADAVKSLVRPAHHSFRRARGHGKYVGDRSTSDSGITLTGSVVSHPVPFWASISRRRPSLMSSPELLTVPMANAGGSGSGRSRIEMNRLGSFPTCSTYTEMNPHVSQRECLAVAPSGATRGVVGSEATPAGAAPHPVAGARTRVAPRRRRSCRGWRIRAPPPPGRRLRPHARVPDPRPPRGDIPSWSATTSIGTCVLRS